MAAEFLRSHGIDLDAELARIQLESTETASLSETQPSQSTSTDTIAGFQNVCLPDKPPSSRWNVEIANGKISRVNPHDENLPPSAQGQTVDGKGALLAPSLCHPHVHIDKAYLLSHPKYVHLQIEKGDFAEAMTLTGTAKRDFEEWDLLERGQRLIDESVAAGVTHMRAFVEVDAVVGTKCLEAGYQLKQKAQQEGQCVVQLCAFAQLPLFTSSEGDDGGETIRKLMREAAMREEVDVVGSTPYVEGDREKMERNVEWMVDLSANCGVHLDFHLDYNLDANIEPMVWHVLRTLKEKNWKDKAKEKTVVLGHCTRLTLFGHDQWTKLKDELADLPVSFVGLPTSDLFMMRTPDRTRGTLDVPRLIKEYGLNACMGINNIGNAFTPHGTCDPVTLACNGVGIYQAGTKQDAELLYECVSARAKRAIGLTIGGSDNDRAGLLELTPGDDADVLLFGSERKDWRTRRSISEVVYFYDHAQNRTAYLNGRLTTPSSRGEE